MIKFPFASLREKYKHMKSINYLLAGLLPRLRSGQLPTSETWPIVVFTPGPRPTEAMATRLMPILGERLLPNSYNFV